jgi:hypothetical protein
LEDLADLVGGAQFAHHVRYTFKDGFGYSFEGELTFAIGNVRKDITNAPPGLANLVYDSAVVARLTNTTAGRNTTVEDVGRVFVLLPHETGMGSCYASAIGEAGVNRPTALGRPFCVAGLSARSGPESFDGPSAAPNMPVVAESGLVRDQNASGGSPRAESAVDLAVTALSSGQVAGFELTVETSSRSGQRLVFDANDHLVASCVIEEFDSFAEICAL